MYKYHVLQICKLFNNSQIWRDKETPILYSSEHSRGGLGCPKFVTVLWYANSFLKDFVPICEVYTWVLSTLNWISRNSELEKCSQNVLPNNGFIDVKLAPFNEPHESRTSSWANVSRQGSFSSWLQELLGQHLFAHYNCESKACITQCFLLNKEQS